MMQSCGRTLMESSVDKGECAANVIIKIGQIGLFALVILMSGLAGSQEISTSEPPQATNGAAPQTQIPSAPQDVPLGEPLEWSLPKYPKEARKLKLQGDVGLILHVNEEGKVTESFVLGGPAELIKTVTDAVKKWSYVPYEVNGHPVPVTTKILARFSIPENRRPGVAVAFEMPTVPVLGPIYKVGPGVTAPKPLKTPDPEYSQEAKHGKYQGRCDLGVVIGPDGRTYDIKVTRYLGEGLDEKAIEAVRKWRFEPARKDGKPVAVAITVQVEFHLQ
jgi:TonB family protein